TRATFNLKRADCRPRVRVVVLWVWRRPGAAALHLRVRSRLESPAPSSATPPARGGTVEAGADARTRSLIADAAMPTLTAIPKTRIVTFGVTWRASMMPAPTTGNEIPTYAAKNTPVSDSAVRSGGEMLMTVPTAPLKIAPDPAPISAPPAMNKPRDGGRSHTARTASAIPMTIDAIPASRSRVTDQVTVRNWAATPAPNITHTTPPARAKDAWCSVTARNSPARPANRPNPANATNVLSAAAK